LIDLESIFAMPGLVVDRYTCSGETQSIGGGYKLPFPTGLEPPKTGGMLNRGSDRRFRFSPERTARSTLQNSFIASMEAPELEFFAAANIGSRDYASMDAATANGSSSPMMLSSSDFAPARHSTACCTDLALRREIRKKFANQQQHQQLQQEKQSGYSLANSSSTLSLGHSFRREIEAEDRVENLQLWEEFDQPLNAKKAVPHSWHGESHGNHSGKKLENSLRKTKGLVQGFFQTLGFSSRRSSSGVFRRAS
jgi:hypothetical protein